MPSKRMKALSSAGRTAWAKATFTSKERELFCVNAFLFSCPIPGVSSSGKHVAALDLVDNGLASKVLKNLFGDLDPYCCYSNSEIRQVARRLIDLKLDGGKVPNGTSEFLIFSKSPNGVLKDHYGLFVDKEKKSLSAGDVRPYDSILVLDAVYRHLRNGLAHGSFVEVKRKCDGGFEPFLYLQDSNKNGQITARFYLSKKRLNLISDQMS